MGLIPFLPFFEKLQKRMKKTPLASDTRGPRDTHGPCDTRGPRDTRGPCDVEAPSESRRTQSTQCDLMPGTGSC